MSLEYGYIGGNYLGVYIGIKGSGLRDLIQVTILGKPYYLLYIPIAVT